MVATARLRSGTWARERKYGRLVGHFLGPGSSGAFKV